MNGSEFHFIRPDWLWALIPYTLLAIRMFKHTSHTRHWASVCDAELLPYILQQPALRQSSGPVAGVALALLLVIFALAGPTWKRLPVPVFRNDSAWVIVLDLSRSMLAADIRPDRLQRARYKIADLLKQRKDGQTALLVYAGDAFTVAPLTEDTATINAQLAALTPDIMPVQGSHAAPALQQAVRLFKQAGLQQGHILLVTDGVDLDAVLPVAKQLSPYRLSVLAVGTEAGAPVKLPGGGFLKDPDGTIIVPKLQTRGLRKLAQAGGGLFQLISADDRDIQALLRTMEPQTGLQQSGPQEDFLLDQWQDEGPWLLLVLLPLAASAFRKGEL